MENIETYFEDKFFFKNESSIDLINEIEKYLNFAFPTDYKKFLENYDGGEGFTLNEINYLTLYGISNIISVNTDLHNELDYPSIFKNYIFIGKDAGPTYYGFKKSNKLIYEIPELISNESEIEYCITPQI